MRHINTVTPLSLFDATKTFLLLLVLIAQSGWCQNTTIDSLESILPGKSGEQRIDILYELAYQYGDLDNAKSLEYGNQALKSARKSGDSLRIVKAGRIKSYSYRRINEIDSSLILSSEILPIARRNNYTVELKSILNGLAFVSILKATYDKALKYLFESLELRKSMVINSR